MNYPNCNCNVCGLHIYHPSPRSRDKVCGKQCKAILVIPARKLKPEELDRYFAPRVDSVFDCVKCTTPRIKEQSYHPSKTLRVRTGKVSGVTTKGS